MNSKLRIALLFAAAICIALPSAAQLAPNDTARNLAALSYGRLPLSFEPMADSSRYLARSGAYTVMVGAGEVMVTVPGVQPGRAKIMRLAFDHAAPSPLEALEPLPGVTNYYLGNDAAQWRVGVKNYAKLRARGIYPGVDAVYYGDHRRLEFDFVLAPYADPGAIVLSLSGMDKLSKDASGDLVAEVNGQRVRLARPLAYQKIRGVSQPVAVDYELSGAGTVRLRLGEYERSAELVIDPVVSYLTYLGGSALDVGNGIAVDSTGNAYVTGQTCSTDFPNSGNSVKSPDCYAYVTKYNAAGTGYLYTSIIGGTIPANATAVANGISVDSSGNTYIIGTTNFQDMNTVNYNGLNTYQGGDTDAFITILSSGGSLVRTSYLGGSGADYGYSIAADYTNNNGCTTAAPCVAAAGETCSQNFPAYNGFEPKVEFCVAFATKLDNALHIAQQVTMGSPMTPIAVGGSPAYYFSLFFGGLPPPSGGIVTAGWLAGTTYPIFAIIEDDMSPPDLQMVIQAGTTGATEPVTIGPSPPAWNASAAGSTTDGTITWINLGHPTTVTTAVTEAYGVAVDPHGDVLVAGGSNSKYLGSSIPPNPNVIGGFLILGGSGAWVFKVSGKDGAASTGGPIYANALESNSTDLSGTIDTARGIAVDNSGDAYVTGTATGTVYTIPTSYQPAAIGADDVFLVKLSPGGDHILYGTYLGGTDNDQGLAVAVDGNGDAYVTGSTQSTDFPIINPITDPSSSLPILTLDGTQDAFVAKFTPDGSALIFSAYLGGSGVDQGNAIAVDTSNQGNMYVAGTTTSVDLVSQIAPPAPGYIPPQNAYGGGVSDAFVTMIAGNTLPVTTVSPGSWNFGTEDVGALSAAKLFTYNNPNAFSSVSITSISFGGADGGDFIQIFPGTAPGDCVPGVVNPGSSCDIWVVFSPSATGARTGTLVVADSASSAPHGVTLSGTGASPRASFNPTSLTFPATVIGISSTPQGVVLTDTGSGTLDISGITITGTDPGDFSQTNNCPAQLASGANCTINVTFTPTSSGTRTAYLTISDNAQGSPQEISLTGTVTAVSDTISPSSLTFTSQPLNSTSLPQTVTVNNTDATFNLVVSNVSTTGNFAVSTNNCVAAVTPGNSCTLLVTFTPLSTGPLQGTLVIAGNGSTMPATLPLSGTGISPTGTIQLSPSTLPFGNQTINTTSTTQTVTLTNISASASLTVSSIALSGNTDFAFASSAAPACSTTTSFPLTPGASCTIGIAFKPTATGGESATLTVTGSASNSPQTVSITGTGTAALPTGPDYTLTPQSTGVSVVQGGTATYPITIAPVNGFTGTIDLTCTAPTGATCSFSTSSISMDGTTSHTTTLSVPTGGTSARLHRGSSLYYFALLPFGVLGVLLLGARHGRRRLLLLTLLAVCLVLAWAGCSSGASSGGSSGLAPGSYSVVVTATSTGSTPDTHTLTLSLVVTSK